MYYLKFTPLTTDTTAGIPMISFDTRGELEAYLRNRFSDDSITSMQFCATLTVMLEQLDLIGSFDAGHLFISKG